MRTALFFDGKNFYSGWRDTTNRQQLDFAKLSQWLVKEAHGTHLFAAHYYTGIESGSEGETRAQVSLSRFLDWLDEQPGFFVQRFPRRTRTMQCDHCGESVRYTEEKEVDTTLVADLVRLAAVGAYDIAVLISGDGDYGSALEAARALGKQTYVATWGKTGLSNRLRRAAFDHLDLLDGLTFFGREPASPPTPGRGVSSVELPSPGTAPVPATPTRKEGPAEPKTPPMVQAEDPEASDLPQELQVFLEELRLAEAWFTERSRYLGANYFVTRWQSERLNPSFDKRRDQLSALESLGRVEIYATPGGDLAIRSR